LVHLQGGLDVSSSSADGGVPDLQKLQLVWDSPRTYGSLLHKRQLQMLFPLEVREGSGHQVVHLLHSQG
jgi:hypothetical protein